MLKISISGTHSVGKTTLVNNIKKRMISSNIHVIPEVARVLIDKGFKLNQDITEYGIVNYITDYLFFERTINSEILISDRSLIDLLAYVKTNNSKKIRKKYVELIEEVVYEESKRFDFYIYLPIEFKLIQDNVRPENIDYQKQVDITLVNLFKLYKIKPYTITGTISQRTNQVLKIINGQN